ncbi:hypothetical protein MKZ38_007319 [Zalerion maritima]|uniref:Uncharacterized protein n=1 Tax=Zalerion maritima TaxID=339359 RepID=A0AAD5RI54_9PEZI|nr:hypothetical protein MKZ38_007319 [Zalerion maritima]
MIPPHRARVPVRDQPSNGTMGEASHFQPPGRDELDRTGPEDFFGRRSREPWWMHDALRLKLVKADRSIFFDLIWSWGEARRFWKLRVLG